MTDGVFSMDGDVAPLRELADSLPRSRRAAARRRRARVWRARRDGRAAASRRPGSELDDVPILMCTLGKAFGTFGAFVAGSETLIETPAAARAHLYLYDGAAAGRGGGDPRGAAA